MYDILDIACRADYGMVERRWINDGKIFLLCFAINDKRGYEWMCMRDKILRQKEDVKEKDYAMILVATQCDLLYDEDHKEKDEFIDRELIIEHAREWNIPYIETSAKDNINVDYLFEHIVYQEWIQKQIKPHSSDE